MRRTERVQFPLIRALSRVCASRYHDLQYQMRRLNRVGTVRLRAPYSLPIASHFSLLTGQFQCCGSYDTRIAITGRAYSLLCALLFDLQQHVQSISS